MSLLSKIFNKSENNYDARLESMVIYNTYDNFIILIQYGQNDFYSAIEFINNTYMAGLNVLLSHYAEESIEENTQDFKVKTSTSLINHRYYMLVSGSVKAYANIFNYLSLSNNILKSIVLDIYNNCDSNTFKELIDNNVLYENKFKYKNIKPKYDNKKSINFNNITYDDIDIILNNIPKTYSGIDILRIINIYDSYTILNARDLLQEMLKPSINDNETTLSEEQNYIIMVYKSLAEPLYSKVFDNLSEESLTMAFAPIYIREDNIDPDISFNEGQLSFDQLDELFQQKYDRFSAIVPDDNKYKSIDEEI